jgi:hypothetical protein
MRPEYKRFCIDDHFFSDKIGENEDFFLFFRYREQLLPGKSTGSPLEMRFYGTGPHHARSVGGWPCKDAL